MTNKLDEIYEFIQLENGEPTLNEDGIPALVSRPPVRDLERLIKLGKTEALEKHAEQHVQAARWDFAKQYIDYLEELSGVEKYNDNLPIVGYDESGNEIKAEPKLLPTEPTASSVKTVDEVLKPFEHKLMKMAGFFFNEINCSISESDQNGIEIVHSRFKELKGKGIEFKPFPFFLENGKHVVIETEDQWLDFREKFWGAREAYMYAKTGIKS